MRPMTTPSARNSAPMGVNMTCSAASVPSNIAMNSGRRVPPR
jgi:hypothetical protein